MNIFMQLLPVLLPIFSPIITALIEKVFAQLGIPAPPQLLPLVNGAAGTVISSLAGAPPQLAVIAGPLGATYGNRIREAHNKTLAKTSATPPPKTS